MVDLHRATDLRPVDGDRQRRPRGVHGQRQCRRCSVDGLHAGRRLRRRGEPVTDRPDRIGGSERRAALHASRDLLSRARRPQSRRRARRASRRGDRRAQHLSVAKRADVLQRIDIRASSRLWRDSRRRCQPLTLARAAQPGRAMKTLGGLLRHPTLGALAIAVLLLIAGMLTIDGYGSVFSLRAMLVLAALLAVAAVGQTLVVIVGGIDLSIPFLIGFANVIAAQLTGEGMSFVWVCAIV